MAATKISPFISNAAIADLPGQSDVAEIARTYLEIETLENRGRDALDFHTVSVASLKRALLAAFAAGQAGR